MKGRWFFWIPVILFGIYMAYINAPYTVKIIGSISYVILSIGMLISGSELIKDYKIKNYTDIINLIKKDFSTIIILFLLPSLLYFITLFFDHYFTIKKHEG